VLGNDADQERSLRVLARAGRAVRAELARRMRLRKVPRSSSEADQSLAGSARILAILQELGFTGEAGKTFEGMTRGERICPAGSERGVLDQSRCSPPAPQDPGDPGDRSCGESGSVRDGVLVCGVGRGTKVLSYLMDLPKEYVGTIRLGLTTDSGDVTGQTRDQRPSPSSRKPRSLKPQAASWYD